MKSHFIDTRLAFYVVYEILPDGTKTYRGYAPMGSADVSRINPNYIINGTVQLSKYAARLAKKAGIIFN